MYYLVYISTAIKLLEDDDLRAILIASRRKNTARNISGLLLYADGVFIQLLEGDKMEVELAYRAIELDRRHKNLIILVTGEYPKRMFPNWSMGYSIANKDLVDQMTGYMDPSKPGWLIKGEENPAVIALKTFAENNNIST